MTGHRDIQVVALELARGYLAAQETGEGSFEDAVDGAIASVGGDAKGVGDLVAILASNVAAMALMQNPHDPGAALDQLEEVTTLIRLDFDEDQS